MTKGILIPAQLWLSVPIVSDAFSGAAMALSAHPSDGLGHAEANGGSEKTWVHDVECWAVSATNKAVGTPTAGADVVTNGNMETGDPPTGWVIVAGTGPQVADERTGGAGTYSMNGSLDLYAIFSIALPVGTWYSRSGWMKGAAGSGKIYLADDGGGPVTSLLPCAGATWGQVMQTGRLTVAAAYSSILNTVATRHDDISAKSLTLSSLFSTVDAGNGDSVIDVKVAALLTGTQAGGVARLDSAASPANFIIFYFNGAGNVKIDECIAGVYASLATAAKAFTADNILRLALSGSAWRLYHITSSGTAVLIGSGTTNRTTGSLAGLFSTSASNTFSGFTNYPTGTGGEYASLDNLL